MKNKIDIIKGLEERDVPSEFNLIYQMVKSAHSVVYQQVNTTLISLYWSVGQYVSVKTSDGHWGKGTIDALSAYINERHPSINGFSARNIWRMKKFYETYGTDKTWSSVLTKKRPKPVNTILSAVLTELNHGLEFIPLPSLLEDIPWTQHMHILSKTKTMEEKLYYLQLTATLRHFLLELGSDFTLMGQEFMLQVGNKDFRIDLLMFHRGLNCMVAIELKTEEFKPEHLGQLQFYLEALDSDFKKSHENPSVGILICSSKDDEVVKYALNRSMSPTMIADYETKLINKELLMQKIHEISKILALSEEKDDDIR